MEFFMKIPVTMTAEKVSVVKNDPERGSIPWVRIFEFSQRRGPETVGNDHALKHQVRP